MSAGKIAPNPKKAEIRKDVETRLKAMSVKEIQNQSKIIIEKILKHPKYKSAKRISLFLSLPNEVPTQLLLEDILLRGDAPFVPQYCKGSMKMMRVLPGDLETMVETSWKIKQHAKSVMREDAIENGGLDLVISPGAAFTRDGSRLGHGGGYYDRYLTELLTHHEADPDNFKKPYIVAIGFHQQIYPDLPMDEQDVKVDEVLTDS